MNESIEPAEITPDRAELYRRLSVLVPEWMSVPEVAERLALDPGKVRRLVQERRIVGVRIGEPAVFRIPAAFLVPEHLANPANATEPTADGARSAVLSSLGGTLSVLGDAGFDDAEAVEWLFTVDDALQAAPIDALRTGRKTEVRRRAQLEL